jgi:hypothetical protein
MLDQENHSVLCCRSKTHPITCFFLVLHGPSWAILLADYSNGHRSWLEGLAPVLGYQSCKRCLNPSISAFCCTSKGNLTYWPLPRNPGYNGNHIAPLRYLGMLCHFVAHRRRRKITPLFPAIKGNSINIRNYAALLRELEMP